MTETKPLDPGTTALLTIDVQPTVLSRFSDIGGLLERVRATIETARDSGVFVAYARVYLTAEEAAAVSPRNKMFGHFAAMTPPPDGPESQVDQRLGALPAEPVFRKTRMGSFSTTDLDARLRERGVDTLVLTGVATSGAVLSTAREAADRDYRVMILSDCCADFDPEVHRVLMEKVLPMTAEVLDAAGFEGILRR
ncbi:MAG: cysteine hydrolase [Rhodococcus sp. (in: high G+C Gram-positive bacteria)]|nr:MAG: cysteine hydrolase [Rhodococcus sp. (in: high G+C Gram-positive bacteria)]